MRVAGWQGGQGTCANGGAWRRGQQGVVAWATGRGGAVATVMASNGDIGGGGMQACCGSGGGGGGGNNVIAARSSSSGGGGGTWSLTRRDREVVDFKRYHVKNYSELTNFGNLTRIEGYNGK